MVADETSALKRKCDVRGNSSITAVTVKGSFLIPCNTLPIGFSFPKSLLARVSVRIIEYGLLKALVGSPSRKLWSKILKTVESAK
jgi:hypothetical protein